MTVSMTAIDDPQWLSPFPDPPPVFTSSPAEPQQTEQAPVPSESENTSP